MKRHYRRFYYLLLLFGFWLLAPHVVFADNCSSLNDCYYTLRAALAAAVGLGIFAALMAVGLDIGPLSSSLRKKGKGSTKAMGIGGEEPDAWDRSLGVVSIEGLVGGSSVPGAQNTAARKVSRGGIEPDERLEKRGGEAPASDQATPRSDRTADQARDANGEGSEGRSPGQASGSQTSESRPAAESGGVAERAEDATTIAGPSSESHQMGQQAQAPESQQTVASSQGEAPHAAGGEEGPRGLQQAGRAKQAPGEGARGSEHGRPPVGGPRAEDQMSQAAPRGDSGGESARVAHEVPRGDRTVDTTRSGSETAQPPAGRSGEWSGERGGSQKGVADSGDVADRARDVADAFDRPERMAQGAAPPDAPSQAKAPHETGQQRTKTLDSTPTAESAGDVHPPSSQAVHSQTPPVAKGDVSGTGAAVGGSTGASATSNVDLAKDLLRAYSELTRVPGMRLLFQQVALNAIWAARGAAVQLAVARGLRQKGVNVTRLEDVVEGRAGADVVTQAGPVVEAKNYYWAGPFFQVDENVTEATRRLVRQMELLRRRYPQRELQLAFSDLHDMPGQMRFVLRSIGVEPTQIADAAAPRIEEVVDEAFLDRMRGTTAAAYWQALLDSGWKGVSAALEARVQNGFNRDPESAWLSLAVCAFDAECIYETNALGESYAAVIHLLARHSQGALQLTKIVEQAQGQRMHVSFENGGRRYARAVPAQSDYFDLGILDTVNAAIADGGDARRFVPLPAPDQMIYLIFASDESRRGVQSAGLLPPTLFDRREP